MKRTPWTDIELQILRKYYADTPTAVLTAALKRKVQHVYAKAKALGLHKSEEFLAGPHSGRTDGTIGQSGRFTAGLVPWNKGKPGSCGNHPNCRRTQFKKGSMSGAAQRNYVPIGSYRLSKDGYLEMKTNDEHPVPARRWIGVHRLVWEAANGPVPRGHIIVFLPGQRSNVLEEIKLERIECISLAENMRRNTYHRYPKEIARAIQLRGALNRRINREHPRLLYRSQHDGSDWERIRSPHVRAAGSHRTGHGRLVATDPGGLLQAH